jgi:hypothetical protein
VLHSQRLPPRLGPSLQPPHTRRRTELTEGRISIRSRLGEAGINPHLGTLHLIPNLVPRQV